MKPFFHIVKLCVATTFLFPVLSGAQDTATGDRRLATIRELYEAEKKEKVDVPFDIKLGQLNGQLDLALEREEAKAIKDGSLDLVTAIRSERKALTETLAVLNGDVGVPAKLKQFRAAWGTQKAGLDAERATNAAALALAFGVKLEALERTLTKETKIQDALAVRKFREGLAAARPPASEPAPDPTAIAAGWITILDGKSLDGWTADFPAAFQLVEGGVIARKPGPKGVGHLFYTGADSEPDVFRSFEVRIRVRLDGDIGNSGFFFHAPPNVVGKPTAGFEVNIANGDDLRNQTGSIWGIKDVKRPIRGQDKTFEMLIRVTEEALTVSIDGREVLNHVPESAGERTFRPSGGAIALQANSMPGAYIFERIDIRKLD
ncbi:MAG: hypothetical protein ACI8UO_004963 [Verrucomicrobiales bacterium]|jgi:hypothetical protein